MLIILHIFTKTEFKYVLKYLTIVNFVFFKGFCVDSGLYLKEDSIEVGEDVGQRSLGTGIKLVTTMLKAPASAHGEPALITMP